MNTADPSSVRVEHKAGALLDEAFRIFFLSVAVWGVLIIPAWLLILMGQQTMQGYMLHSFALHGTLWHAHEMVYGLVLPAFAGFLMTAAPEWTRTEPLKGWPLLGLWLLWVLGRVAVCHGGGLPHWIPAAINLAFVPAFMIDVLIRVFQKKAYPMIAMVFMVGLFWLPQWQIWGYINTPNYASSLIIVGGLMMVIGSKITMTFGRAWLQREHLPADTIHDPKPLLALMVLSFFVLYGLLAVQHPSSSTQNALGVVSILAAVLCVARIASWRAWAIHHEVNIIQLSIGLLWVPTALVLLAAKQWGWGGNNAWMHALAVGGMGTILLAVMSRVPLAHTGRKVQLGVLANVAFWTMHVAAVIRVVTALEWLPQRQGLIAAGTFWTLAFALYAAQYAPIFSEPKFKHVGGMLSQVASQAPECQLEDL